MPCQSVTADYSLVYAGTSNSVFGGNVTDRIISMNANIGLGSESSSLNFTLAGEPSTNVFGVTPQENVGRAVIFQCNNLQFGGMIKSLTNSEDGSGNTTKVTLTCAKELLSRYDILLNKSACSFDSVRIHQSGGITGIFTTASNINGRNVHADIEGRSIFPQACGVTSSASGPGPGSYLPRVLDCNKYGAANEGIVARGATTYRAIIRSLYQTGVRIHTIHNADTLRVNFTPILNLANSIPYASTSAYKMTLLELINNVCDEAGYDFHCSMNGQWITFQLVNKRVETVFGSVQNIINTAKNDKKCISSSSGAEFKGEKTNRVVCGPNINYIKEVNIGIGSNEALGAMVIGFSGQVPSWVYNPDFVVPVNTIALATSLSAVGINLSTSVPISERELITCGNLDTWKLWGLENPNSLSRYCMVACGLNVSQGIAKIRKFGTTHYVARSAVEAVKTLATKGFGARAYEDICYPFFRNLYDTYYGKYYMVILPAQNQTCFQDPTGFTGRTGIHLGEGGAGTLMDQPISSGWPDYEGSVLGTDKLGLFFDSSGKLTCFIGVPVGHTLNRGPWNATFDPSSFTGDYFRDGSFYYTKCEVDGRAYNIGGRLGILVKMPSMLTQKVNLNSFANNNGLRAISLCYGSLLGGLGTGFGTTNTSYANIFKENLAAGGFTKIAIPMRNNQIIYGPWAGGNSNGLTGGGVDIQVKEDLNPWQYGGYANMHSAGVRVASQGLPWRTRYESGHVTIAESPAKSLGSIDSGPLLSSVVVKFDKSGSTTTYNYETYKPKFGNYAENFNEYIKKNVADRRDNYNILRETYVETLRNQNQALRTAANIRERLIQESQASTAGSSSASINNIMLLSYPDPNQGQQPGSKTEVGAMKTYSSDIFQDRNQFLRYAAVGMDMIFSPVSTAATSLMSFMLPGYAGPNRTAGIDRMPPYLFNGQLQGDSHITNFVLNPYTTSTNLNQHFTGRGVSYGIQTDYIAFGSSPDNVYDPDNNKQDSSSVRAAALRGPLMLHSWGYDVNGKPVPNQNPSAPTINFAPQWLNNPRAWPVGPIDLRWDARRGVWTSTPPQRLVVAQLLSNLSIGGIVPAVIISSLYNDTTADNGTPFNTAAIFGCDELSQAANASYPKIYVRDVTARPINVASRVVCYHIGNAVYIPIMIADTYQRAARIGCCTIDNVTTTDPNSPCFINTNNPCEQLNLIDQSDFSKVMVEGLLSNGTKVLHDLVSTLGSPGIYNDRGNGQMKVLGYEAVNDLGFPCMTGIPIVNCTGEYPGSGNPLNPI